MFYLICPYILVGPRTWLPKASLDLTTSGRVCEPLLATMATLIAIKTVGPGMSRYQAP